MKKFLKLLVNKGHIMKKFRTASFKLTMYFFVFFILITGFQNIIKSIYIFPKVMEAKTKFADNSIKILLKSIENKLQRMGYISEDYAKWDTLYNIFESDGDNLDYFVKDNFSADTLKNLHTSYVGLYDINKNFMWNGYLIGEEFDSKVEIIDLKSLKIIDILENSKNKENILDIYTYYGINYFFSISKIKKTDYSGEAIGYFIFASEIDAEYIEFLGEQNNMKIEYIPKTLENKDYFEKKIELIEENSKGKEYKYYYDNEENHYVYFKNVLGEATFILKLNFYDGISKEELSIPQERYLQTSLAFIIMLLLYIISKKKIVKPIEDLSTHIVKIIDSNKYDEVIENPSTYEVENLVNSFNRLIKKINIQNKQIENMNGYLRDLAYIDPLTKLYNRRKFQEKYDEFVILSKKNNKEIALILCDVDYFKPYNDYYGHIAGDKVLIELSEVFQEVFQLEKEEIVFRYGGEEFAMLLYDKTLIEMEEKLKELQEKIKKLNIEHNCSEASTNLTLSFGFIIFKYDEFDSINEAIHKADKALYTAKEKGRNQYIFFK